MATVDYRPENKTGSEENISASPRRSKNRVKVGMALVFAGKLISTSGLSLMFSERKNGAQKGR